MEQKVLSSEGLVECEACFRMLEVDKLIVEMGTIICDDFEDCMNHWDEEPLTNPSDWSTI